MAQMPVPVPMSRMVSGFSMGARKNLSSSNSVCQWWAMSRPSFWRSSLGPQYSPLAVKVRPWMRRYSAMLSVRDSVEPRAETPSTAESPSSKVVAWGRSSWFVFCQSHFERAVCG